MVAVAQERPEGTDTDEAAARALTSAYAAEPVQPGSVPSYEIPGWSIRVILARRGGFGSPVDTREVEWPAGWRLPQAGDSVHVATDWGGFVESVDFVLQDRAVRVNLR